MASNFLQGLLGNLSEISIDTLSQEFGEYLIDGEEIQTGFKLIRDAMVITNCRLLTFDRQGTTGKKMRVRSIYLDSICYVTAETAGFGIDDSELTISYIASPYMKTPAVILEHLKFEFPKKYNIQKLYRTLQDIAYENHIRLNS